MEYGTKNKIKSMPIAHCFYTCICNSKGNNLYFNFNVQISFGLLQSYSIEIFLAKNTITMSLIDSCAMLKNAFFNYH